MRKFLIPAYGPQRHASKVAFGLLAEESGHRPSICDTALFFYAKINFKDGTAGELVGPSGKALLLSGRAFPLGETATVRLVTLRTIDRVYPPDAVILFYATDQMLEIAESLPGLQLLIVVPWTIKRIEEWVQSRVPLLPGVPSKPSRSSTPAPEMAEALWALTVMVDRKAPLSLNSERETALELLEVLHSNDLWLKPNEFKIWALRNGWSKEGGTLLDDLAKRVEKGEKVERSVHWGLEPLRYFRALYSAPELVTYSNPAERLWRLNMTS